MWRGKNTLTSEQQWGKIHVLIKEYLTGCVIFTLVSLTTLLKLQLVTDQCVVAT
jgi:hypothetical protein